MITHRVRISAFGSVTALLLSAGAACTPAAQPPAATPAATTAPAAATAASGPAMEGGQERPYTATDFGPWNAHVAAVHVPQITFERTAAGLKVTVKVDDHPMDPSTPHYIMWIRIEDADGHELGRRDLAATDPAAVASFELSTVPTHIRAFDRCNVHGIWTAEADVPAAE